MKILGLISSDAHGGKGNIPQQDLFPNAMQAPLGKAIGEPVETVARALWPNPGVHLVVRKWLEQTEPDMVLFAISSFWFTYESTPVRLERKLGTPGRFISQQSQRVAATPWLAHNRAFQWGRKQTQKVVGGQSWFEPEEVIARSTEIIREVIQREGSYLVVCGPGSGDRWNTEAAARERAQSKQSQVDKALAAFCLQHHVEYVSPAEMQAYRPAEQPSLQGDELHLDREGHRRVAEHYFKLALGWVERAQAAATREELDDRQQPAEAAAAGGAHGQSAS